MACDAELADRMRQAIGARPGIDEKRMMGSLCFFLNGNMIGGADRAKTGERRFMFRLGKDNPALSELPGGEPALLGGRLMPGFRFVDADRCDDGLLERWLSAAMAHAASLPPK